MRLILNWVKCGIDGSAKVVLIPTCGGTFWDKDANYLGSFAINLPITTSFQVELHGLINDIEITYKKNWSTLWLEIDSQLGTMAFINSSIVSCHLRNR